MIVLANFLMSLLITLIGGVITHWVFKHFASDKAARLAAFWLTLGGATTRYSFAGPLSPALILALGKFAGAALALVILWWWLLRRLPVDEG